MLEPFAVVRSYTAMRLGITVAERREVGPWRSSSIGGAARRKLALGPQVVTPEVDCSLFVDRAAITAHPFGRLMYSPSSGILAVQRLQNRARTLRAIERDLADVRNEAEAEGWPTPSDSTCSGARRLLVEMFEILPCRYEVYPTPHGEVAIDLPSGFSASILVLCISESRAMYFVTAECEEHIRDNLPVNDLPDQFLRQQLVRLIRENRRYD